MSRLQLTAWSSWSAPALPSNLFQNNQRWGDPPLFLGFLKGVSFFWTTTNLFLKTALISLILLCLYFGLDAALYAKEGKPQPAPADRGNGEKLGLDGKIILLFLLGVVLVYFIMVAQFQSLKSPFIVMFTIPLAFTGGFLALLVTGIEVSVISLIGFVMLVGVIVNNGIVLVDYINQQRLAGMERREAIIDAGVTRLRPILMTSLTTILGLIVTAAAKNAGTALMQPVAVVCIGGLLYATLMTLFVVPCMYEIMNRRDLRKVDERELEVVDM